MQEKAVDVAYCHHNQNHLRTHLTLLDHFPLSRFIRWKDKDCKSNYDFLYIEGSSFGLIRSKVAGLSIFFI